MLFDLTQQHNFVNGRVETAANITFNSQMHFQCIIKLNTVPETSEMKTAVLLSKLRGAYQKSICLESPELVTIKAHPGATARPEVWVINASIYQKSIFKVKIAIRAIFTEISKFWWI